MSTTLTITHTEQLPLDTYLESMTPDDEDEEEERDTELVHFENCSKGLGIKIIGGCSVDGEEDYGIFVKRVLPGGLAELDGRIQNGDQILEVNHDSVEGVTNERAVSILRQASASNFVEMLISRDEQAREEFLEVLERQNGPSYNCTPIPTEKPSRSSSKDSSRAATPSVPETSKGGASPRSESVYHTPPQLNGWSETNNPQTEVKSLTNQSTDSSDKPVSSTTVTPPNWYPQKPVGQTDRFGVRIQPNMVSTPQGQGIPHGGFRFHLPQYQSQPLFLHSQNLSPVLAPSSIGYMPSSSQFLGQSHGEAGGQLPRSQNMSQSRKLSLDPHVRIKVEKLEVALRYLALDPSPDQHEQLRSRLHVDSSGTVNYGEFVKVARDIFRLQLDEQNIGQGAMLFAAHDLTSIVEPPPFKPEMSTIPDVALNEDFETVKKERDEFRQDVERLKALLKEKEESCNLAEEEILRIRREAQGAIHETRSLRSKVHLAEQAQRAARSMEQDYEEVVKLLENEIEELKTEMMAKKVEVVSVDMEKRLAVVCCQLRKIEIGKKTYEVATEKLLQFVEHVHETLRNEENGICRRSDSNPGEPARANKPPGYLAKHKQQVARSLANESREVVKAVKSLTDSRDLPYGWEETYTEDGMRYFINHLTMMTTWSHPVSNVQHLPTIQQSQNKLPIIQQSQNKLPTIQQSQNNVIDERVGPEPEPEPGTSS